MAHGDVSRRAPLAMGTVVDQLTALGVPRGAVMVVHTAFSQVGPLLGGPETLTDALIEVLGPEGTLVMPSMTDDDTRPFDPAVTPCLGMGIVADTFWRRPDVQRSNSPHAFAARGPAAADIVAPHPVDVPHGHDSPVGRVFDRDGWVLLMGVGQDGNTTVHLAEHLAGVRYRLPYSAMILDQGVERRVDYLEIDHCCRRFALVDGWLDAAGLQRRGVVGHGPARLARSRDVVRVAVDHLVADQTVFLHPPGIDADCDAARASIVDPAAGPAAPAS